MSDNRKRDIGTAAVGYGGLAGAGVLREMGMRRGLVMRQAVDPSAKRSRPPALDVLRAPKAAGRGKARALWAGGSVLGLAAATPAAVGTNELIRGKPKRKIGPFEFGKSLIAEGLKGTAEANKERLRGLKDDVPAGARALQYGVATGAGSLGVVGAHRVLDKRPIPVSNLRRAALTSVAGGAAAALSLPASNKALAARYRGYEATPTGVKRKKKPLKRPSQGAAVYDGRSGRMNAMQMRMGTVPSDARFAKFAPPPGQSKREKRELAQTKNTNAVLSVAGGAAGLGGLATLGASKNKRIARRYPGLAGKATGLSIVGGGIGGANALINAKLQRREAQVLVPVKKADKGTLIMLAAGGPKKSKLTTGYMEQQHKLAGIRARNKKSGDSRIATVDSETDQMRGKWVVGKAMPGQVALRVPAGLIARPSMNRSTMVRRRNQFGGVTQTRRKAYLG